MTRGYRSLRREIDLENAYRTFAHKRVNLCLGKSCKTDENRMQRVIRGALR